MRFTRAAPARPTSTRTPPTVLLAAPSRARSNGSAALATSRLPAFFVFVAFLLFVAGLVFVAGLIWSRKAGRKSSTGV